MKTECWSSGWADFGGSRGLFHQAGAPNNYTDLSGARE